MEADPLTQFLHHYIPIYYYINHAWQHKIPKTKDKITKYEGHVIRFVPFYINKVKPVLTLCWGLAIPTQL